MVRRRAPARPPRERPRRLGPQPDRPALPGPAGRPTRPDFRGYAGTIASGVLRTGTEIAVLPSGQRSKVDRDRHRRRRGRRGLPADGGDRAARRRGRRQPRRRPGPPREPADDRARPRGRGGLDERRAAVDRAALPAQARHHDGPRRGPPGPLPLRRQHPQPVAGRGARAQRDRPGPRQAGPAARLRRLRPQPGDRRVHPDRPGVERDRRRRHDPRSQDQRRRRPGRGPVPGPGPRPAQRGRAGRARPRAWGTSRSRCG